MSNRTIYWLTGKFQLILTVKFLVESGADIEIANRHGHTALMIASYREKADVVRYLLEMGARIDRTSIKGLIADK